MRKKRRITDDFEPFTFTDGPFCGKTVKLASQERIEFVSGMAEHFLLHVLKHPEAIVTDRSSIHDFGPSEITNANYRKLIIGRTKKVYGVDITRVYNSPLPTVLQYIQKHKKI